MRPVQLVQPALTAPPAPTAPADPTPPGPAVSPVPSAETLAALSRRYAVGQALSCERVAQGLLNHGYRLVTTRGRFFLKHHLDGDTAALDRQHRAVRRLAARGVPVAPPLADAHGRTVAEVAGRHYALHPWIEGRHRHGGDLTAPQCRRLGALLGQVHTQLAAVIPAPSAPPRGTAARPDQATAPAGGAVADPAETHGLIDELLARVRARHRPDSFDALAEHRLLERRVLLRRWAGCRPQEDGEPAAGWVHGDFHPYNLLYADDAGPSGRTGPAHPGTRRRGEPVAIVDWDRLGVQPRAEEAVRAALLFFVRPDGSLELGKVRAYARAYRRAAGATGGELHAAVHRVWWERLNDFWMLRWRYQLRDCRADPLFPAASALVGWWTRRYGQVRDAFLA